MGFEASLFFDLIGFWPSFFSKKSLLVPFCIFVVEPTAISYIFYPSVKRLVSIKISHPRESVIKTSLKLEMNSSSLSAFFSLPFFNCRLYVLHTIIVEFSTLILLSIINKWHEDLRSSCEFYSMYGTDGDSDSEPDLVIMGLLEEHQNPPLTMKEVTTWCCYSIALTHFQVPWFRARAQRGTTLYLDGVMFHSSVHRYSVTLKRTCYLRHMTSVFMLVMFQHVALSPWLLIKKPISHRIHPKGFNQRSSSDLVIHWCWIWLRTKQGVIHPHLSLMVPPTSFERTSHVSIAGIIILFLCRSPIPFHFVPWQNQGQ